MTVAHVAVVDDAGKVTGMGQGAATITAYASSGVKATAKVTVSAEGTPVTLAATSIAISPSARTQKIGESVKLDVLANPVGGIVGGIDWTSDRPAIAMVDMHTGVVTAVAEGEAIITATTQTGLQATCTVRVKSAAEAEKALTLAVDFLAIAKGKSFKLNNLTGFKGTWTVSDANVASISKAVLKANNTGEATLTFTVGKVVSKNAKFMGKALVVGDSVDIKLYVVGKGKAVTKITLKAPASVIAPGETMAIAATMSPKSPTYHDVFWRSADPAIATVGADGVVTGIAKGDTVITGTTTSGLSKTVKVKVSDAITKMTINKKKVSIKRGATYVLEIKSHLPAGLGVPALEWTSSKPTIATVDPATGLVLRSPRRARPPLRARIPSRGLK